MSNKLSKFAQGIIGLGLILLICWVIYVGIVNLAKWLLNVQSDVSVAIIAAAASIVVSSLSLIGSKYLEQRQAITQELRAKKVPVYEKVIFSYFRIMLASKLGEQKLSEQETVKLSAEITQDLVIWGANNVVTAYAKFRDTSLETKNTANPLDQLYTFEDILLEIRKDLGHSNTNIKRGTLLSLFINDLPQLLSSKSKVDNEK